MNQKVKIIEVSKKENTTKLVVKNKGLKYIYYDKNNNYQVGDVILIEGILSKEDGPHAPGLFDYEKYLKYNNIKGIIENPKVTFIKKSFSLSFFHHALINYSKKHFEANSRGIIEALVIGSKNSLEDNITSKIQNIGISHLFVISGLHMGIVLKIAESILKFFKIKEKFHFYIITSLFFCYFVISLFSLSILRVLLIYVFSFLNKKYHLEISTINIYAFTIFFLLLINPHFLFSYSFILTFLISSSIVLINPYLQTKKVKGFFLNSALISINSMIVTLPIVCNINPKINILSVVYNLFYIPLVSYFLLPLSFLVFVCPFLKGMYHYIIIFFIKSIDALSNIECLKILFPTPSIIIVICFYFLYLLFLYSVKEKQKKLKRKSVIFFVLLLAIWSNSLYLSPKDEIYFLNLAKGEASLMIESFARRVVLIDTGENYTNELELFLMKKGIKKIDYLIISHGDSDHAGKVPILIKEFKVKKVITSIYDEKTKTMLKENGYKGQVLSLKKGDELKSKNFSFLVLSPFKKSTSSNNNSLVLQVKFSNFSLLFTGDIEKIQEQEFVRQNPKLDVDVLKVPHHGSITSSSAAFLNHISYKYAICMNGYANTFSFPHLEAVKRYDPKKIKVTSNSSTISFQKKFYQKRFKIN